MEILMSFSMLKCMKNMMQGGGKLWDEGNKELDIFNAFKFI